MFIRSFTLVGIRHKFYWIKSMIKNLFLFYCLVYGYFISLSLWKMYVHNWSSQNSLLLLYLLARSEICQFQFESMYIGTSNSIKIFTTMSECGGGAGLPSTLLYLLNTSVICKLPKSEIYHHKISVLNIKY